MPDQIGNRQEFAEALTGLRLGVGLTVRQVASRVGANGTHSTIGDWFSGRGLPSTSSRELLVRVLEACGVTDGPEVERWLAAWQRVRRAPGRRPGGVEPYRGLAPFGAEHAEWFFGREALTGELVACVEAMSATGGVQVVVGSSGSGKSSLLRAGLVPALDSRVEVVVPGAHPMTALAMTVDVLVVDQFEEVFTACADEEERRRFVAALHDRAAAGAVVVIGLRADFYAHVLRHPQLVAAVREHQLAVGPMTAAELRRAIVEPARKARIELDDGLVEVLLVETAPHEPGMLPLLSHALYATWRYSTDRRLTVADYREVGGIRQAVAATADDVHQNLSVEQRDLARQMFLALVHIAPDTADTRRRLSRAELFAGYSDDLAAELADVLDRFVAQRLITADADTVQLSHEALLSAWPLLRSWLEADRAGLIVGRRLGEAAAAWHHENRDPTALYRGTRLAVAREWAESVGPHGAPGPLAAEFLRASADRELAERHADRRRSRRLRRLVAGLVVLLLLTTTAVVVAVNGQRTIRDQRDTALAGKAANEAADLRATNPALAAQLALAAYRLAPTSESRTGVLSTSGTPYARQLTDHTASVRAARFSADGRVLATASVDGTLRLWSVADPHNPRPLAVVDAHPDGVSSLSFSPDGRLLATAGADRVARLWDVSDPRRPLGTATGHTAGVTAVSFSPDGRTLVTAAHDRTTRLWDVTDPRAPVQAAILDVQSNTAVFSPDRTTLVTAGSEAVVALWDVSDPRAPRHVTNLTGHTDRVLSATFSPDGRTLATGGFDNTVRVWDVPRGVALTELTGHGGGIASIAFGSDGHTLATGGYDQAVILWDIADTVSPSAPVTLAGHSGTVYAVAFSPDGDTLATGSGDNTARLWDLRRPVLAGNNAEVNAVAFSRDGRTLVGGSYRTARVWDLSDPTQPVATLSGHTDGITAVTFAAALLATASLDGTVRLWNLANPSPALSTVELESGNLFAATFSPDGQILAVGGESRKIHLLDPNGTVLDILDGHTATVEALAFSPDGRTLASGSADHTVRLWDTATRTGLATITGHGNAVRSVAFSPEGHTLASGSADHTVRLHDVTTPRSPSPRATLTSHTDTVNAVAFSPDGTTFVSGSADHTTRLWDARSATAVASLLGHTDSVYSVAFSPDGRTLATSSDDATARLWDVDPERVAAMICELTDPPLTRADWDRHFPDLDYRPPCT